MSSGLVVVGKYAEHSLDRLQGCGTGIDEFHIVVAVLMSDLIDSACDHHMRLVDQGDVVEITGSLTYENIIVGGATA